jgi:hypothetical protein
MDAGVGNRPLGILWACAIDVRAKPELATQGEEEWDQLLKLGRFNSRVTGTCDLKTIIA